MTAVIERAKITSKGQTTVPKAIRQILGVSSGDEVEFRDENGRIYLEKVRVEDVHEDPAIVVFLGLIEQDIANGKNVGDLPSETVDFMRALIGDAAFDPDEEIEGDSCL